MCHISYQSSIGRTVKHDLANLFGTRTRTHFSSFRNQIKTNLFSTRNWTHVTSHVFVIEKPILSSTRIWSTISSVRNWKAISFCTRNWTHIASVHSWKVDQFRLAHGFGCKFPWSLLIFESQSNSALAHGFELNKECTWPLHGRMISQVERLWRKWEF